MEKSQNCPLTVSRSEISAYAYKEKAQKRHNKCFAKPLNTNMTPRDAYL